MLFRTPSLRLCRFAPFAVTASVVFFFALATSAQERETESESAGPQIGEEALVPTSSEQDSAPLEDRARPDEISSRDNHRDRARLSDAAELDRIIELYMAGNYSACAEDLSRLLDPDEPASFSDPAIVERGRLYYATCSLLEGDEARARKELRAALQENPLMPSPDSLTFPPPVVSLFLEVRDEVQQLIADREREQVLRLRRENEKARRRAELRMERERQLEELAGKETIIAKNSRILAALPYGVGQFQNGDRNLGGFFLVTEGLLTVSAATSGLILEGMTARKNRSERRPDKTRYDNQTEAAYLVMKWSTWSLLGVYALGVLEAQLRFKPERRLADRPRPLPPDLDEEDGAQASEDTTSDSAGGPLVRPSMGVLPGGGFVGVTGRF